MKIRATVAVDGRKSLAMETWVTGGLPVAIREVENRYFQSQIQNLKEGKPMPSFDIVSEVDTQELDNALNQARKELATRFDFKNVKAEILLEKGQIILTAEDGARLRGLREIVIGKLSKRGVDLRNVEQPEPSISSMGHARQELKIKQGLEG